MGEEALAMAGIANHLKSKLAYYRTLSEYAIRRPLLIDGR